MVFTVLTPVRHKLTSVRRHHRHHRVLRSFALTSIVCLGLTGCASLRGPRTTENETPSNLVVLNAPTGGTVRRVLVSEGVAVDEGAPVIEIAVRRDAAPTQSIDPGAQAQARVRAARQQTRSLEEAVQRAAVEVQRVQSLIATNAAPRPQLDAAQAEYQRAQERLQQAQAGTQDAQRNLDVRRTDPGAAQPANPPPTETIVSVRATAPGTLRVVSVRVGQEVRAGQPLATVSTGKR